MCLIITALAAVISTLAWYFIRNRKAMRLGMLAVMYWGASLMWTVDGVFNIIHGEPFLDLSGNDAVLGLTVVFCGFTAWLVIILLKNPKNVIRTGKKDKIC